MNPLSDKRCIPCEGGVPPLTHEQIQDLMPHVPGWHLSEDDKRLSRTFTFKDFKSALSFANEVGKLAEEEWHHPDMGVSWGKVELTFTTHAIGGLAENDFIMAAKVNGLAEE